MHIPLFATFPETATLCGVRDATQYDRATLQNLIIELSNSQFLGKIAHGETVVIGHSDPVSVLIHLFAAWANGNKAVLVNPGLTQIEQEIVTKHTQPVQWFGANSIDASLFARQENSHTMQYRLPRPIDPDAPALVLMTSGTTGTPKGIVHTIRTLKTRMCLNLAYLSADILENTLCVLPLFFGHGLIGNCLTPLAAGKSVHLWTTPTITELADFADVLNKYKITFLSSVPTFWKLALRMEPPKKTNLKRVSIGSAPLAVSHWQAIKNWTKCNSVFNMYGMTETANWVGGGDLKVSREQDGYVGKIWGGRYAIRTEKGEVKSYGRGEIIVDTPSVMTGYLNAPDLTDNAIVDGWFRTGDIGELDQNGELVLIGRSKTEINRGGIKILAEEIDMMLERHDAITEACAFGLEDQTSGEVVAAAIVIENDEKLRVAELRKWCQVQVRSEAVPTRFFFVDEIPKNDRGKIVRQDVKRAVVGNS